MLTSEYSTGSMRTSLTVMPRRTVLYGAKLAVFAAISLGVAVVTSLGAFFLGQALLGGDAIAVMTATSGSRPPHMFSAWGELAVFAAYAAVLLAIGAVQFRTRDA